MDLERAGTPPSTPDVTATEPWTIISGGPTGGFTGARILAITTHVTTGPPTDHRGRPPTAAKLIDLRACPRCCPAAGSPVDDAGLIGNTGARRGGADCDAAAFYYDLGAIRRMPTSSTAARVL